MLKLTLPKPVEAHVHLRDGDILKLVAPYTAKQFAYAVVMPNLVPPITTTQMALEYGKRISDAAPELIPLMTLYLTDNTPPAEIAEAKKAGIVGVKYYPAGATTNSDSGVTDLNKVYGVLEAMQTHDMPLLIHGEVTEADIDVFDREAVFIERYLRKIVKDFPGLRIVFEHITTKDAAEFVWATDNVFASITAHHLLFNRNAIFKGGVRPHYYCLPILKREVHREALVKAARSGNKKFFAGTDSAPHTQSKKEAACGCAGCFTATHAVELYATAFEVDGKIDERAFVHFMHDNAVDLYKLEPSKTTITIEKIANTVASNVGEIIPLQAGEEIGWKVVY